MGLLYDYTYLTANGYLQKFRDALNAPYLNRAELTKILKIFNDRYNLVRFIVKNEKGIPCLYHKDTLNRILGIDRTGITVMNPKSNSWLNAVRDISDGLDEKDKRLIMWFRSLPPEKQKAILALQDAPEDLL